MLRLGNTFKKQRRKDACILYMCILYTYMYVYVFVIQNIFFYLYLAHDLCERKASFLTYKTNHLHWVSILCTCLNRAASRPAVCDGLPHHASWCPAGVVGGSAVGVFGITMSQEKEELVRQIKLKLFIVFNCCFFLRFFQFFQTHAFLM